MADFLLVVLLLEFGYCKRQYEHDGNGYAYPFINCRSYVLLITQSIFHYTVEIFASPVNQCLNVREQGAT